MALYAYRAGVAAAFAVLLYFATDKLTETPPTWFDEGVLVQVAMQESLHGIDGIQTAPGVIAPATYVTGGFSFLRPISWSFSLFGIGLLQARVVMVCFILAVAAVFFLLMYSMYGRIASLGALALLSTFPPLYGQGKNVLGEVPGLFFLGAFLVALFQIETNRETDMRWYAAAGVFAGLAVVTKPIFILLPIAIILTGAFYVRRAQAHWQKLIIASAAFLLPVSIWFLERFFLSDSLVGLLSYYANPYSITDMSSQVLQNFTRFFTEASPAYFALLMAVWTLALALRVYRKEEVRAAEICAFFFALLVSLAYLRTPGWYRYFFLAEIPALVFASASMLYLVRRIVSREKNVLLVFSCIVFFMIAGQVYQLLVGSWVAQHSERTTTHDISAYMQTLPSDASYFVYNTPASVIFLPSKNYYQYLELNDSVHLGADQLSAMKRGLTDYIITDDARFRLASSSMTHYRIIKTIDSLVVLENAAQLRD